MSEADRIKRHQLLTAAMREQQFQSGIRDTPWYREFTRSYREEPNLEDPNYDYRAAWDAGVRPDVIDPNDKQYHWSSQFKGPDHPNRFVNGIDTIAGKPVEPIPHSSNIEDRRDSVIDNIMTQLRYPMRKDWVEYQRWGDPPVAFPQLAKDFPMGTPQPPTPLGNEAGYSDIKDKDD